MQISQQQAKQKPYHPKKLCTDIFKKPITLSCGHTFCYHCLYKYMKQQHGKSQLRKDDKDNQTNSIIQVAQEQQQQNVIPLPLCPTCCSLIFRPIKHYKQNLTLTNLIAHSGYQPQLKFPTSQVYDPSVIDFEHKILLEVEPIKIEPMPFCFSEIRFRTCFLDDVLEQSQGEYLVLEWKHGWERKGVGLAGKIIRTEEEYRAGRAKESHYKALFYGMFFVDILQKKPLQINLKSRYYVSFSQQTVQTEPTFCPQTPQLAELTICKTQPLTAANPLPLSAFQQFFFLYDTLNNDHYLSQIYRMIDQRTLFERNNPQAMIYCCLRVLKFRPQERSQLVGCFDDEQRMQGIRGFLAKNADKQIEEIFYITIPGNYSSAAVFGVIIVLILLHYLQSN